MADRRIDWNRRSYTPEELTEAWNSSESIMECMRKLGRNDRSSALFQSIKAAAFSLGLTTDHMTGKSKFGSTPIPDGDYFVEGSRAKSANVKARAIKSGYLENVCQKCGLRDSWQGEPISLQLDHINGDNRDNRLENLRLLCPNCHSQTDTFNGRNVKSRYVKKKTYWCCDCSAVVSNGSTRCQSCNDVRRKLASKIPSREDLIEDIVRYKANFTALGESYGVSCNTVKKWCDVYGLPRYKKELKQALVAEVD